MFWKLCSKVKQTDGLLRLRLAIKKIFVTASEAWQAQTWKSKHWTATTSGEVSQWRGKWDCRIKSDKDMEIFGGVAGRRNLICFFWKIERLVLGAPLEGVAEKTAAACLRGLWKNSAQLKLVKPFFR